MAAAGNLAFSLRGAFRLAIGQAGGVLDIGQDGPAVARSFWAAALCLPAFLLLHAIDWRLHAMPARLGHALGVQVAGFAIGWAGFLLACRPALAALGRLHAWPRLVAVWNWCNVAQHALWLLAAVPAVLHAGAMASEVAGLVTLGWALWLEWFALRLALGLGGFAAAGIVALDVLVGLLVDATTAGFTT